MPRKTGKTASLRKSRYFNKFSRQPHSEELQRRQNLDEEYLVRALSHDVGAHLMILEYSFRQYDQLAKKQIAESQTSTHQQTVLGEPNGEYRAEGGRIIFRQDPAARETLTPHRERRQSRAVNTQDGETAEPPLEIPRLHLAQPSSQPLPESDKLTEAASHVTACIDEMRRFVEELISFAKTGSIDMEPTTVSIAELVNEVLYEQRGLIKKRRIETVISSPLPTVFANPTRIKQVLTNLIRNAAIHGCDEKHPMIVIAADILPNTVHLNDDASELTAFYVRDNGHGIPPTECEHIFEPGYRVAANPNEGSGIGLAIVDKIATYYGGQVTCDSTPTATTFTLVLPRAR